jgi:cyanophycinase
MRVFTGLFACVLLALTGATQPAAAAMTDAAPGDDPQPASEAHAGSGRLVIVGGALRARHADVYRAVLDHVGPTGRVGVLPTASGVPEESGPGTVEDFQRHASEGQVIELIDVRHDTPELAHDPQIVAAIEACDAIWFTGGDQSRIIAVFRPEAGDTPGFHAIRSVLQRGGVIGGTSAGAAMMSDPMIRWGNSHEALLLGAADDLEDFGVAIGRGMGFFPFGVTDQHFIARGRLGRLLVACDLAGVTLGFGVEENCALVVDLATGTLTAVGEPGLLAIERVGAAGEEPHRWRVLQVRPGQQLTVTPTGGVWRFGDTDAQPPTMQTLEQSLSGRPRSYDGPDVFAIEIEGDVMTLLPTDATESVRAQTRAAWEARRAR